jgi:D-erythro-7,8-dihydroneopterin triphosphate epimerase
MKKASIRIENLKIKTLIGIEEWERCRKQEVIIHITLDSDLSSLKKDSPQVDSILNYKTLTKKIIHAVEESRFFLLEKLTEHILNLVMEDKKVLSATVKVDKPKALKFADSVSIEMTAKR